MTEEERDFLNWAEQYSDDLLEIDYEIAMGFPDAEQVRLTYPSYPSFSDTHWDETEGEDGDYCV